MFIYLLTNSVNGKYYVGKTVHKNLNSYLSVKRWAARHGKHPKNRLISAMSEFGYENFIVDVLAKPTDRSALGELEKIWIALLDSCNPEIGYNTQRGGNLGNMGNSTSEEVKRKIGAANKGRKPVGYIRTELHRQQLRDRMKGNDKGVKFTSETAKKWKENETVEQRAIRGASIKAAWDSYTPEQRAARIAKMKAGHHKGEVKFRLDKMIGRNLNW